MSLPQAAKARLAIDVGGTFTDVVLDRSGQQWTTKVLTTHDAPERAVIGGIEAALTGAVVRPDDIDLQNPQLYNRDVETLTTVCYFR